MSTRVESPAAESSVPEAAPSAHPDVAVFRLGHVDGLRALAALYVLAHHAFLTACPSRTCGDAPTALVSWLDWGHFAVSAFIVISGYVLMLPVTRSGGWFSRGAWLYLRKRARRILPPYWAALALSVVLILTVIGRRTGTHWDIVLPLSWKGVAVHTVLLQDLITTRPPNHVFWSIALEWQIYFVLIALLLVARRVGVVRAAAGTLVLSYFVYGVLQIHRIYGLWYVGLFALGVVAAHIAVTWRKEQPHLWPALAAGSFGALVILVALLPSATAGRAVPSLDLLVGLGTASLLVHTHRHPESRATRLLSVRALVGIGLFSYSVYLVHAPLLQIVWQYVVHPLHLAPLPTLGLLLAVGGPAILAASYAFHRLCERPFMNVPSRSPLSLPRPLRRRPVASA